MRGPLVAAVRSTITSPGAPAAGEALVVGLSGGADSVALLDALRHVPGPRLVAAHLDHGLRPDSGDDLRFCQALCEELGVPLRVGRADVTRTARRDGDGLEAAARDERYAFLRRVAREGEAAWIAVAHTRDDQAETLLLHLLRGTGSHGLSGMRRSSGDLLRPLLGVSRAQVLAYLEERGLSWREDPSNTDPRFTRNRVRNELLPWLEARFNPRLRETLAGTAALLADEDERLEAEAAALLGAAQDDGDGWSLPRVSLRAAHPAVARRALRRLALRAGAPAPRRIQVERLLRLACEPASSGRRLPLTGENEARIRFDSVHVGPRRRSARFTRSLDVPGTVALPDGGVVTAWPWDGTGLRSGVTLVPAERPLTVRSRRPGDRARRNGREVSLKRLLLDRRVPADRRDALPLVAAGREVLWGPGLGIDASHPGDGGPLAQVELRPGATRESVERG